ncbi:amphiregulin-like [Lissotriton helveticus]
MASLPLSPCRLLLCTLAVSLVCRFSVLGSTLPGTESANNVTLHANGSLDGAELPSGGSFEEEGDYDSEDDPSVSELVAEGGNQTKTVKPEKTTKKGEKRNGERKKKKQGNKENKKIKKESPCETTHKDFCIHGKCRYLDALNEVACICHHNFIGQRCSDMFLRTKTNGELSDTSTTALAIVAVLLSTISFIAIAIVIGVHMKKTYSTAYEGETEEKKRLGHENGDMDV